MEDYLAIAKEAVAKARKWIDGGNGDPGHEVDNALKLAEVAILLRKAEQDDKLMGDLDAMKKSALDLASLQEESMVRQGFAQPRARAGEVKLCEHGPPVATCALCEGKT